MAQKLHYTIESRLKVGDAGLEVPELGLLLESAIKFFLFQRTQIPVPFNSLYSASNDDIIEERQNTKDDLAQKIVLESSTNIDLDPEESENALERTRRMKQERKQKIQQRKRNLRIARVQRQEFAIRMVLDNGLRILQEVVNSSFSEGNQVVAVVLMLGPSMLTSKEIICFEIDKNVMKSPGVPMTNSASKATSAPTQGSSTRIDSIIRHFYQTVICTSAFGEFTSNQMSSTYTHLNIMTRSPLSDNLLNSQDLKLIEDDCFMQVQNSNISENPSYSRPVRCKTLIVKINAPDNYESSANEVRAPNISNLNSVYCYNIPLVFKGVRKIKV